MTLLDLPGLSCSDETVAATCIAETLARTEDDSLSSVFQVNVSCISSDATSTRSVPRGEDDVLRVFLDNSMRRALSLFLSRMSTVHKNDSEVWRSISSDALARAVVLCSDMCGRRVKLEFKGNEGKLVIDSLFPVPFERKTLRRAQLCAAAYLNRDLIALMPSKIFLSATKQESKTEIESSVRSWVRGLVTGEATEFSRGKRARAMPSEVFCADPFGALMRVELVAFNEMYGYIASAAPSSSDHAIYNRSIIGRILINSNIAGELKRDSKFSIMNGDRAARWWVHEGIRPHGSDLRQTYYLHGGCKGPVFDIIVFSWLLQLANKNCPVLLDDAHCLGEASLGTAIDTSAVLEDTACTSLERIITKLVIEGCIIKSLPEMARIRSREGEGQTDPLVVQDRQLQEYPFLTRLSDQSQAFCAKSHLPSEHARVAYAKSLSQIRSLEKKLEAVRFVSGSRISLGGETIFTEGTTVEFKHHISEFNTKQKSGINTERIRHTIAAMASTCGGVLLVGVADDGTIVGNPRGAVVGAVRTTGFAPSMARDAVRMREFLVTDKAQPTVLMNGWWKLTGSDAGSTNKVTELKKVEEKFVTVIIVEPGAAPFYLPSLSVRSKLPIVRGLASNMKLSVLGVVSRFLPLVPNNSAL